MSFCWYLCVSLLILCEWIVTLTFIETGSRVACWIYVYVTLYMYIIMCEKLSILTFFQECGAWNKYFGCFLLKMFSLFVCVGWVFFLVQFLTFIYICDTHICYYTFCCFKFQRELMKITECSIFCFRSFIDFFHNLNHTKEFRYLIWHFV